jgi:quinol monooxygenase YgiN
MIITTIKVRTTAANRKELMQTFCSLSDSIQKEQGCNSSTVYHEVGNNGEAVMVIQEWGTEKQLDNHLRSNQFAVMLGAMSLLEKPLSVEFQVLNQVEASCSLESLKARNRQG